MRSPGATAHTTEFLKVLRLATWRQLEKGDSSDLSKTTTQAALSTQIGRKALIVQLAPQRCPNADEIVFEAFLDEPTPIVLPVPFIDAEPLCESMG